MSESKGIVIEEQELREMARSARGCIQRIFLHWSGGHYGANEDAYHLCVDRDGQVYVNCRKLSEEKAHTWLRNSNAAAISLLCGYGGDCWPPGNGNVRTVHAVYVGDGCADPDDAIIRFGNEPPTEIQIEVMAKLTAILCEEWGWCWTRTPCRPTARSPLRITTVPAAAIRTPSGICGFCRITSTAAN